MARSVKDALLMQEVRRIGALVGDVISYAKELGATVITLKKRADAHEEYIESLLKQNRDLLELFHALADKLPSTAFPMKKTEDLPS
jgi:hypothetical protein